jgi:hypothetical protein
VQVVIEGPRQQRRLHRERVHAERHDAVAARHLEEGAELQQELAASGDAPTSAQTLAGAVAYTSSRGNVTLRLAVDPTTVYQKLLPYESCGSTTPSPSGARRKPCKRSPFRSSAAATPRERCGPGPDDVGTGAVEELRKQWFINTGELSPAQAALPNRPLIDLVCWDNELRAGGRSHTQPFGGM